MKNITRTINTFTVETAKIVSGENGKTVVGCDPIVVCAKTEAEARKAVKLNDDEVITAVINNGEDVYTMPVNDFIRYAGIKEQ